LKRWGQSCHRYNAGCRFSGKDICGWRHRLSDGSWWPGNIFKGLLTGKQPFIINTHGKLWNEYESIGMNQAFALTSDRGIYTYCGLEIREHCFFDKADKANTDSINSWMAQIKSVFSK
jgi:putative NADPH-quinone reductase